MHRKHDELVRRLRRSASLAKNFTGWSEVEVTAPENEQFLEAVSRQVLQGLLGTIPAEMRDAMVVKLKSMEWRDGQGVSMEWGVNLAGVAADSLSHVVGVDARDIASTKLGSRLTSRLHELRERLSALEHRSTESEV